MLSIYNSLTRRKEIFRPIVPGQVRLYVCGMTVYDYCHIGHARVLVVFDVVYRYLKHLGYEVLYVRNITDIDDKIIQRAKQNDENFLSLTRRFIDAMHDDSDQLGILRPDHEPRATDHIESILRMIEQLIGCGSAYQAGNGDVYFDVSTYPQYGKLSGKQREALRFGERVNIDKNKRNPADFVLWKTAKPGEPNWPSMYGNGRPGWHIECSAMSTSILGNHFDIHGGGQDLQFPHHENEIAQSECCTGETFVNYWMHNGFVQVNEEKMSKSLGNFFTLRDVMQNYKAEEIRYFILSSHYRSQLNYSEHQLNHARRALQRLYGALLDSNPADIPRNTTYQQQFQQALDDDFNTADALAVLFNLVRHINRSKIDKPETVDSLSSLLKYLAGIIGLLQHDPAEFLQAWTDHSDRLSDVEVNALIEQRLQARNNKDWCTADSIRDQLTKAGITIEDEIKGTRWRRH